MFMVYAISVRDNFVVRDIKFIFVYSESYFYYTIIYILELIY